VQKSHRISSARDRNSGPVACLEKALLANILENALG
jgi:hypothetical protein